MKLIGLFIYRDKKLSIDFIQFSHDIFAKYIITITYAPNSNIPLEKAQNPVILQGKKKKKIQWKNSNSMSRTKYNITSASKTSNKNNSTSPITEEWRNKRNKVV